MCENTINSQRVTIADTVAFDDTIDNTLEIINVMYMMTVLKSCKSIKFLVMLDQKNLDNNAKFTQRIKLLNDVFGGEQNASNNRSSIAIILNLMNSTEGPEDKKLLKDELNNNMSNLQNQSNILKSDNIFIFDPFDSNTEKE